MKTQYQLSSYDYYLPEEQIAQQPVEERETSRLLILDCSRGTTNHHRFADIASIPTPGDLLVMNNTKVFPARLIGRKQTGGRVEMLLLHFPEPAAAQNGRQQASALALIRSSKRPKIGSTLIFSDLLQAGVTNLLPDGKAEISLSYPAEADLEQLLEDHGQIPLPPYISRPNGSTERDVYRYQTRYARHTGSVAAPTAGLHFSDTLLTDLDTMGIRRAEVTLHVGYGTFAPVRCNDIRKHAIHEEFIRIPHKTARAINDTKAAGGRIWAVGTTTARTLEFAADKTGRVQPGQGLCNLYIYPGYRFVVVDNLITNFHLPRSSLLFLVSALAGREQILAAYNEAVQRGYRFFSYGDAMAIITR